MANVKFSDLPQRSGSWAVHQGRTYRTVSQAETFDSHDGPAVIMEALAQRLGDRYVWWNDIDHFAFLTSVQIEEESKKQFGSYYKVTIEYGPYNMQEQQGGTDSNPLLVPPSISWGFRDLEFAVLFDIDGNPVVNTAGELFDPPLTEQLSMPVMTIQRNEPIGTYSPAQAYLYRNAINADIFAGENPGTCRCLQIGGKRTYSPYIPDNGAWYFEVTYEFEFSPDGYRRHIPSMGYRQRSLDGTKLEHIYIKNAVVSNPVLLDSKGRWMTDPTASPYLLEFKTKKELPFAVFGFDEDWLQGLV